jgi:putative copper export protein
VGASSGTYGFEVAAPGTTPATVTGPKAETALGPVEDGLVAWVTWITLMTFVGALALCLVVTGPVASRIGDDVRASTRKRLVRVASAAIVLFVPAFVIELAHDAAPTGGYAFDKIWPAVFADPPGTLTGVRMILTGLALVSVVPFALGGLSRRRAARFMVPSGAVAGALDLVAAKFPTVKPEDLPRTVFQTVVWCAHLLGAAVWVGGLVGLLAVALPGAVPARYRGAFWGPAIRRYSASAMSCVAALILSGLWLYWVHIDGVHQLLNTLYGQVLGVKLIVFGSLLLLGSFNQFWLSPKIDALRAAGDERSLGTLLTRHFRVAIAAEVVLGLSVLLIAPFLSGSSRNQAFQAKEADLTRTSSAGLESFELTPSGLQPGRTSYVVRTPDDSARTVTVSFASTGLRVPTQTVEARRTGAGTYRVEGYYTPQVGRWQVGVAVDNAPAAQFILPVTATAEPLGKSLPPDVRWTTWFWGIAETLGVIIGMVAAFRVSGRIAQRRMGNRRPSTPAAESDGNLQRA